MADADRPRPPFLLRLARMAALLVAWFCVLQLACFPLGKLQFTWNGRDLPQRTIGMTLVPGLVAMAILGFAIAHGIRRGDPWVRWLALAVWVVPLGVLVAVTPRSELPGVLPNVLLAVLPPAGVTAGYLFFSPAVQTYFRSRSRRSP